MSPLETELEIDEATKPEQPQSLSDIFFTFNALALQGFGGVLPVAQRALVEKKRWLTQAQFVEMLSIGQILPGPNIVNLSLMVGDRHFGWRGALAALGGMLLLPLLIVLTLAALYTQFANQPVVSGALRGMGAVAAGLILATGFKLMASLRTNVLGLPVCLGLAALTFVAVAVMRWPLVWVLLGLGSAAVAGAWWRLAASQQQVGKP
jgi:chromate transporter